jgi:hypothetical protein
MNEVDLHHAAYNHGIQKCIRECEEVAKFWNDKVLRTPSGSERNEFTSVVIGIRECIAKLKAL